MALIQKTVNNLIHTYSNADMMILQTDTGIKYSDAWDPVNTTHTYAETTTPIDAESDGT